MLLLALLAAPLLVALPCRLLYRQQQLIERLNVAGALLTAVLAGAVVVDVASNGPQEDPSGLFYVDALSAVLIGTIAAVGLAAALVSVGYLRRDLLAGHLLDGRKGLGWYYFGFHIFIWTMLATVSVANLGLLWVGIEATTLASALLVGFYRTKAALEAAWKYIILCTVGITFALFGVLLTYYAAVQANGDGASLEWTALSARAAQLDPALMKLAFVFILIGFGTKAGFAPLHTWLADAHSQAPSPISGVLSGVLLACALYAILRFQALTAAATGTDFASNLLLAFGVFSVAVAVPFILIQRDLKRLLAYSSVEHIGLMAVAFGIGGPLGTAAGLLHLVNHALTKALLFFAVHQACYGVYLGCTFAPNHKGMPVLTAEDELDFLRKQVLTSRNVRGGRLVTVALGGLNYQIEHHLFPSMPTANLHKARPIVRDYCASLGIGYVECGLFESWGQALRHLHEVGRPLRAAGA